MGHLQGQIRDLERYITFLQTKQTRLQPRARRHGSEFLDTSSDASEEEEEEEDLLSTTQSMRNRHVTFSDEVSVRRCPEEGDLEPPLPEYRVSMSQQLDGVNCALDYSRCEWEKMDSFSNTFQGPKQVCGTSCVGLLLLL